MSFTHEVLAVVNEAMGQSAVLRKHGTQAVYFCNFCHHHKRKMEVNLESGLYHCWVCNQRGKSFGSLFRKLRAPKHLRDKLVAITGDIRANLKTEEEEKEPEGVVLPEEFKPLHKKHTGFEYKTAMRYLASRNVTMDDIVRHNIGFCETGAYKNRIIIPSYDREYNLNFYVSRLYQDYSHRPPYKNCPYPRDIVGFESFVNYDLPINIVEGAFDAFAVRFNVVPLFGKYMSKRLVISLIENKVERVNMILDNDAIKDALKNAIRLSSYGIGVHFVKLNGKDPSKIGFEAVHKLIRDSKKMNVKERVALTLS